jgi:hypothetical protein
LYLSLARKMRLGIYSVCSSHTRFCIWWQGNKLYPIATGCLFYCYFFFIPSNPSVANSDSTINLSYVQCRYTHVICVQLHSHTEFDNSHWVTASTTTLFKNYHVIDTAKNNMHYWILQPLQCQGCQYLIQAAINKNMSNISFVS